MSNEITKLAEVTENKIIEYLDITGIGKQLSQLEKKQFIEISSAFQLNPFKREIYCIPYMKNVIDSNGQWKKERAISILTGYEVYIKRAERVGALDGWNVETKGKVSAPDFRAIATIYRKDWSHPFIHVVFFTEYKQDNKIWKQKPVTMIKKVAIAQSFRMCFPDEFAGMPYTSDELPDEMTEPIDTPPENPIVTELNDVLDDGIQKGFVSEEEKAEVLRNADKYNDEELQQFLESIEERIAMLTYEAQNV
ncbi:MAG: phage recombination protein Bet [Spirochaetales bacterium]|nr:phage recombination protein Bet [Spirochaetales bacterium]